MYQIEYSSSSFSFFFRLLSFSDYHFLFLRHIYHIIMLIRIFTLRIFFHYFTSHFLSFDYFHYFFHSSYFHYLYYYLLFFASSFTNIEISFSWLYWDYVILLLSFFPSLNIIHWEFHRLSRFPSHTTFIFIYFSEYFHIIFLFHYWLAITISLRLSFSSSFHFFFELASRLLSLIDTLFHEFHHYIVISFHLFHCHHYILVISPFFFSLYFFAFNISFHIASAYSSRLDIITFSFITLLHTTSPSFIIFWTLAFLHYFHWHYFFSPSFHYWEWDLALRLNIVFTGLFLFFRLFHEMPIIIISFFLSHDAFDAASSFDWYYCSISFSRHFAFSISLILMPFFAIFFQIYFFFTLLAFSDAFFILFMLSLIESLLNISPLPLRGYNILLLIFVIE